MLACPTVGSLWAASAGARRGAWPWQLRCWPTLTSLWLMSPPTTWTTRSDTSCCSHGTSLANLAAYVAVFPIRASCLQEYSLHKRNMMDTS